ncbi:MAG TPA: hypothetical protein VJK27_05345 [Terriglobales bacterium]|jgi:hypothetical protein|nr:hypothetical protein [Terriglobales bacterium]
MWIDKLSDGVLELDTPIGARYVQPNFVQRAYLIWIFRNFFSLPQQVLRPWERRLIDRLWDANQFVSLSVTGAHDRPVIGRIERRAPFTSHQTDLRTDVRADVLPFRKPMSGSQPAATKPGREAASA